MMAQYLLRWWHSTDQCPTSNTQIRERAARGFSEMHAAAARLGVRFLAGPLALAVEHEGFALVEAEAAEVVQKFVMHSGLMQWNTVRISLVMPMADVMAELGNMPAPLF
jgi:hypothetical protein